MITLRSNLSAAFLLLTTAIAQAADPFMEGVRPTGPLAPQEQAKTFHLPPGFEIQLVAAEPDIHKPMNMAFDAAGRLWVTTSIEYPFAAPTNAPGRDRLMIFEDFGPNGRARKVTEFAGGLNIPIGVYPFRSRSSLPDSALRTPHSAFTWKCIVWSIPHIWLMEDTDGDGRADRREPLYGPFDYTRDTHGNQASFRRGLDGWLYATHGFNNHSIVTGRDGHTEDMQSGNTYRIRLDGSRIERHTFGQVNPFGLAFDPLGNLFSADCHSSPIYQLLRGAYYPSFGKPHDGLGFAPVTIQHTHGSTAICGITYVSDPAWPAEFQDNLLIGNVMTSRINRDRVEWRGSTSVGHELEDFLRTDDPWFRPVDLQWGPDGALYVADFYNRIIGHYEVPLTHPGRDRERGRIWRIVYRGTVGRESARALTSRQEKVGSTESRPTGLSDDLDALIAELGSTNPARRSLAMNELCDVHGEAAIRPVKRLLAGRKANAFQRAHGLWVLHRLRALDEEEWMRAFQDDDPLVCVQALRVLAETPDWTSRQLENTLLGLLDEDAHVQRAAAQAIGSQPDFRNVQWLLKLLHEAGGADTHLRHVVRMALRDHLKVDGAFAQLDAGGWSDADLRALVDIALAVPSGPAAAFLLQHAGNTDADLNLRVLQHASRHGSLETVEQLAHVAQSRIPRSYGLEQYQELERQFDLFRHVHDGWKQRGVPLPDTLRGWGTNIVWTFFGALDTYHSWEALPYEPHPTAIPWDTQPRPCADGVTREVTSSIVHGEHLTGVLLSKPFALPVKLSFWLCGHNGFPDRPDQRKNVIRLREEGTHTILAEAFPPRHDTARRITWDLAEHAGRRGYVEAVDGDTARAFAWIAFGGFEPLVSPLRPSEFQPRAMRDWMIAALDVAGRVQVKELAPNLGRWAAPEDANTRTSEGADPDFLEAAARTWAILDADTAVPRLARKIVAADCPAAYRERLGVILAEQNSAAARQAVAGAFRLVPTRVQQRWAVALAGSREGADTLLRAAEQGLVARALLGLAGLRNRIRAAEPNDWEARLQRLTQDLPADAAVRQQLVDDRKKSFEASQADKANGATLYNQLCAVCHQLGGQGALVGPQLDGIGNRGVERVLEDIIDPNRNVDHAFRSQIVVLKDGEIITGLLRREAGALLVLVDSTGKEIPVEKAKIESRRESETSLMPDNFGEAMSAEQMRDLVAFLVQSGSR
jgi:putative heme-binding domain-containing protein